MKRFWMSIIIVCLVPITGCGGWKLSGNVYKVGTREGISDVIVEVTEKGRKITAVETDGNGKFEVSENIKEGRKYTLSFSNSEETVIKRSRTYDLSRMSKKQAKKLTIQLALITVITGKIIDEANNPLANATIEVLEDKEDKLINAVGTEQFKTDANGEFTIRFPIRGRDTSAKTYRLRIESDRIGVNYYPKLSEDPKQTEAPHSLRRGDIWSIDSVVVKPTVGDPGEDKLDVGTRDGEQEFGDEVVH